MSESESEGVGRKEEETGSGFSGSSFVCLEMKRGFDAEGDSGGCFAALVPDRDVRVSVKALALSCVGAAVALHPESFFSKLYKVPLDTTEYPGMLKVHTSFLMSDPYCENYSKPSWPFLERTLFEVVYGV